ncbi:uncharacterized protein LOC130813943 isoform X4 [Amaranthus tricolor]|uniref:uncharacterized protein LOC130813943 isoform X4 n=1 Tax=Amaranthus tricolor TaxID=29722 RepID=UPI0025849E3C|nr:uncharacterized protein LOC130813943 isoform X4 [Amaranthus tricolor]
MDDKPEACAECSRFCLSLHKSKLDPLPIVSSFFKVMLGNHFSEVLIVPPRFAKTITELEGKSTYFEDSTGQKWEVYLTNNNGSLAFQKGWREFFVDHNIQLGDFLRKDAIHKVRKFHEVEEDVPRQENTNKRPKVVPKDNVDADNMSITRGNMCFQTPNTMLKADTSKIINDEADWLSTKCVALPNDAVSRAVMPLKVLYPGQSVAAPHTSEFTSPTSCGKGIVELPKYGENIWGSAAADNPSCDSMIISNNGDRDEILYIEAPEHDLCDSLSAPEFKISCSEKTIVNSALQDEYEEEKVVWLVDQVGRIWPVMYNQRGKDKFQELHFL